MTDNVIIFDTTLRDGEQSPGASMTINEKIMLAQMLDHAGVDIIEAGFPFTSEGDFKAITEISKQLKNATICGLARAKDSDIERAAEAMQHANRFRIHTFISTSPLHMEYKLKMTPDTVLEAIRHSVTKAKKYTPDVEWSCEDGTRTEADFLCQSIETAIKAGATTINIPDTVGYTTPEEYFDIITMIKNRVPNIDKAIISAHCHNDLGLAVANSIAALRAGARQIECTINGLGERAGNAAMEEVVMALKVRPDLYDLTTNVDTTQFTKLSRTVSSITAFPVQYNKAIVGKNAFAHESGIHQDGMLKNSQTYEIMRPSDIGLVKTDLVLGKLSGRHAFANKLEALGYKVDDETLNDLFKRFKDLADRKKQVFDDDILMLIAEDNADNQDLRIKFHELTVICGSEGAQRAIVSLMIDGTEKEITARGDGPVDAIFKAIRALFPHDATLELYQVDAVTQGTDAQAKVTVRLSENDYISTGIAAHTDTMTASAKAYIHALNRLLLRQDRKK
ncbi:MAG: 2-isopropylmalate synthase [Dasania sp.]|jgi:2-isopropylmalate synthase